jgi:hypothetical protein
MRFPLVIGLALLLFSMGFALHPYTQGEDSNTVYQTPSQTGISTTAPQAYTTKPTIQPIESINWVFPTNKNIFLTSDGNILFNLDKKNSTITLGLASDLNLSSGDVNNADYLDGLDSLYYLDYTNLNNKPTIPDVNAHFVPYIAATTDVNLNSRKLQAFGDSNFNNLAISNNLYINYIRPANVGSLVGNINIGGNTYPTSDNQFDFGSSPSRFKNIYYGGTLYGGAAVVDSIVGSLSNSTDLGSASNYWKNFYINARFKDGTYSFSVADINNFYYRKSDINNQWVPYIAAISDVNLGIYGLKSFGDSNFNNVNVDNNLFWHGEIVDFNKTAKYVVPIWAERTTPLVNGYWAFGNGLTLQGIGIYGSNAKIVKITAECGTAVGTDMTVIAVINGINTTCDLNVYNALNTTYTDVCDYNVFDNDRLGIKSQYVLGTYTGCVATVWLEKDLNVAGIQGPKGDPGTVDTSNFYTKTDINTMFLGQTGDQNVIFEKSTKAPVSRIRIANTGIGIDYWLANNTGAALTDGNVVAYAGVAGVGFASTTARESDQMAALAQATCAIGASCWFCVWGTSTVSTSAVAVTVGILENSNLAGRAWAGLSWIEAGYTLGYAKTTGANFKVDAFISPSYVPAT